MKLVQIFFSALQRIFVIHFISSFLIPWRNVCWPSYKIWNCSFVAIVFLNQFQNEQRNKKKFNSQWIYYSKNSFPSFRSGAYISIVFLGNWYLLCTYLFTFAYKRLCFFLFASSCLLWLCWCFHFRVDNCAV